MPHNRGNGERRSKGCRTLGAERSIHLDLSSAIRTEFCTVVSPLATRRTLNVPHRRFEDALVLAVEPTTLLGSAVQ